MTTTNNKKSLGNIPEHKNTDRPDAVLQPATTDEAAAVGQLQSLVSAESEEFMSDLFPGAITETSASAATGTEPDAGALAERSELARLETAISLAPIEELRSPIEEELGLDEEVDIEGIRDALDVLKEQAQLGRKEAVATLVDLGSNIAHFLGGIERPKTEEQCPSSPKASSSNFDSERGWRESAENSVTALLNLPVKETSMRSDENADGINQLLRRLPPARYSFPLSHLIERDAPPEKPLREISDLCDRLIQRRITSELAKAVHELSTHALYWPLFVSVVDYPSQKPLAMCAQNLELGTAIGSNLGVNPRSPESPTGLVRPLFFAMEHFRRSHRTEEMMDSMRRSEEMNEPVPLEQLIKEARDGMPARPSYWTLKNIWKRRVALLPPLQRDSAVITLWIDAAYAYLASERNGDLENEEWFWSSSINRKVEKTGSFTSGLRDLLRRGFWTLAGNDGHDSSRCA